MIASVNSACPRKAVDMALVSELFSMSKNVLGRHRSIRILSFVLACTGVLATIAQAATDAAELRVMSFNIRFSKAGHSEAASENNWADAKHPRRERAIRVIQENSPDLVGVQEARESQVEDLKKALPEYAFYGIGRDDGETGGEFTGIYYRKARFTKHGAGSFWLSATPEKPGTSFYVAPKACARIASWVKLTDKESGRQFVLLNMHWDHISEPARQKSAALVRERLATLGGDLPLIVMGDLNAREDSPAVLELIGANDSIGRKLVDSFRELHPERSPDESSFNDWKGTVKGSRIDFIFHTSEFKPVAAEIVRKSYDGHWPSDHYPVVATLNLNRKSK
jgi:endonuclease/exonuclease/phosphatase family metal-dependent hydrolase